MSTPVPQDGIWILVPQEETPVLLFPPAGNIGNGGGSGVSDHGALSGLADDDHAQYHNDARGDARYSGLAHNHTGTYEPANANLQAHVSSTSNPHSVTAAQVGADATGTAAAAVVAHAALTTGVHGLGGASQLNVGTTAGTVAAGDDSRLSDARTPTAHNQDASTITSGTLDAARLPAPDTTTLGGVKRNTGSEGQFVTGVDTDGSLLYDTPVAVGGGTPAGSGTELQYRDGSTFGAMSGTAWDNTTRALTVTGATIEASAPILDLSQTWDNAAVTFTGVKVNITNTASAAASQIVAFQVGGFNQFAVVKDGVTRIAALGSASSAALQIGYGGSSGYTFNTGLSNTNGTELNAIASGVGIAQFSAAGVTLPSAYPFGWQSSGTLTAGATQDASVLRDAANTVALRRTTNAQTFRVYGTYTDASNYVRASLAATSTAVTLTAETAGTGADNVPVILTPAGTSQVEVGNGVQFTEMTAPSAPAANKVILFAQDNGAGKTQLMALFPSGASQQVAIEP